MSYLSEFGSDFQLGFNLADYPKLKDESWHNDQSPRFEWDDYVLWVNDRDCNEYERYTLYRRFENDDGDIEIDYNTVHLTSNNPVDIIAFLDKVAK